MRRVSAIWPRAASRRPISASARLRMASASSSARAAFSRALAASCSRGVGLHPRVGGLGFRGLSSFRGGFRGGLGGGRAIRGLLRESGGLRRPRGQLGDLSFGNRQLLEGPVLDESQTGERQHEKHHEGSEAPAPASRRLSRLVRIQGKARRARHLHQPA